MSKRTKYTGGYVTKTEVIPTSSTATGVWSTQEVLMYKKAGIYPQFTPQLGLFYTGLVAAGSGSTQDVIQFVTIPTTGNASDFGDATVSGMSTAAAGSSTRGLKMGGVNSSFALIDVIDFVTYSSAGNATDFGNLAAVTSGMGAFNNPTKTFALGGDNTTDYGGSGFNYLNVVQLVTTASTGNMSDFGDLSGTRKQPFGMSNNTRGVLAGGYTTTNGSQDAATVIDVMDYFTLASAGNATDFGNLSVARGLGGGAASSTRGVSFGGANSGGTGLNVIDYITIGSTGNASDFGDLAVAGEHPSACANLTRAIAQGGAVAGFDDTIEYITIASTGNASDFGNLIAATNQSSASSNSSANTIA